MREGVLCIGTTTVDYTKKIDHLPELESLVLIDEITRSTGGPGLNIACNLRQLDVEFPVEAIGCIGNDAEGAYIIEQTALWGIDNLRMQRSENKVTSFSDALTLNSNGKRTFLFHPGANDDLDLAAIDLDQRSPRILHLGAAGLHAKADAPTTRHSNQWVETLERARSLGIHTNMEMVYLDPARSRELVLPCLPHLSFLIINESEAGALLDESIKVAGPDAHVDWNALEQSARRLISLGVNQLAVIHTPAGAVAANATGETWRQGSVKVPETNNKGTTGAGDAFASGVVYGLHAGWSVPDCLKLGVATSAQNIQSPSSCADVKPHPQTLSEADAYGYR